MSETPIKFYKRYTDRPFTTWKGGRYRFYLYDNEIEFFGWVFENGLAKEVKFKEDNDATYAESRNEKNPYFIYFKTSESFMAFKLTWL